MCSGVSEDITEAKILAAANQIVTLGLKDAGYEYVNIDDCYAEHNRSSTGELLAGESVQRLLLLISDTNIYQTIFDSRMG